MRDQFFQTIIYGFDANRARQFHQYIDKCSKEAGDEACKY